jgi:tRNA(Ile)-lysidine synthase
MAAYPMQQHPLEIAIQYAFSPEKWRDTRVLLAVSGGADSVALLRAMARVERQGMARLMVAHLHHGLRPSAEDDAQFVRELSLQHGLECFVGREDVAEVAREQGDGIEAAARFVRYGFLLQTAEEQGCRYVLTGHTDDDQVETILHNIIRGCGIAGMRGMPKARQLSPAVTLLRPMLEVPRETVRDYLSTLGQSWREDETNCYLEFTRNRLRHEVLPLLASLNPRFAEVLRSLGKQSGETLDCLKQPISDLYDKSVTRIEPNLAVCRVEPLATALPQLVRLTLLQLWKNLDWPLQNLGYDELQEIVQLIQQRQSARLTYPGNVDVVLTPDELRMSRKRG